MSAILTDPEVPAAELRQRLYDGDLVILTRLRTLGEFVDYLRDELATLFAPHDRSTRTSTSSPPGWLASSGSGSRAGSTPSAPATWSAPSSPRPGSRLSTPITTCRSRAPLSRWGT